MEALSDLGASTWHSAAAKCMSGVLLPGFLPGAGRREPDMTSWERPHSRNLAKGADEARIWREDERFYREAAE
jgi:hypothetical protein